jgi:hypothetical protein
MGLDYWVRKYHEGVMASPSTSWYRMSSTNSVVHNEVDDVVWQLFRGQGLKGTSTTDKLCRLLSWVTVWEGTDYQERACIQVENYLKALHRGGFIRPRKGEDFESRYNHWEWEVIK